jgi:GNAT superfamily N-acetyltransferase
MPSPAGAIREGGSSAPAPARPGAGAARRFGDAVRRRLRDATRDGSLSYRARVALARLVWFECLILAADVDSAPPARDEAPAGVTVRPLGPDDVDAFLRLRPEIRRADAEARLAAGHLGMAVWEDGEIVAVSWTRFDCMWVPILQRAIPLAEGEAYTYDSFTDASRRRQGIATLRSRSTIANVRARGFRRIVGCVLPGNPAALNAALAAGARPIRRVRWAHVGRFGLESVRDLDGTLRSRALGWRRPEPEFPLS